MKVLLGVERLGHEHLGRAVPVGRFARLGVELPSEDVQFVLREGRQIKALREILPKQAIAVLVDAVLPRAVGIGEIGAHPAFSRSFSDADCHAEWLEMALQSIYPLAAAEQKQASGIEENA